MNSTVLARKWRPKKLSELVGQLTTVTVLKNILNSNRLHHAYLLTGTRGVGKTTIARIIAKSLNCDNLQNSEPCLSCKSCLEIDQGRAIDIIEIDAASNTGVDNIRELLDNAQYAPSYSKFKIFIIDEVHMLSKSAFNAMLKTLEEPPAHVCFILATTESQKVPITVLSRCLQLKLRNLTQQEISGHLEYVLSQENILAENNALKIIAQNANGSMRDALSLTDQAIAYSNQNISTKIIQQMLGIASDHAIINLFENIVLQDKQKSLLQLNKLHSEGVDLISIVEHLRMLCYEVSAGIINNSVLEHLAKIINPNTLQVYFEILSIAQKQLTTTNNDLPVAAMAIIRMMNFALATNATISHVIESIQEDIVIANSAIASSKQDHKIEISNEDSVIIEQKKTQIKINSSNWIELIHDNINKLDTIIVPILENSTLSSHHNNILAINIEKKYQELLKNQDILDKLIQHISRFTEIDDIQIDYLYVDNLSGTIKQKVQEEKALELDATKEVFYSDENVLRLLNNKDFTVLDKTITNKKIS